MLVTSGGVPDNVVRAPLPGHLKHNTARVYVRVWSHITIHARSMFSDGGITGVVSANTHVGKGESTTLCVSPFASASYECNGILVPTEILALQGSVQLCRDVYFIYQDGQFDLITSVPILVFEF